MTHAHFSPRSALHSVRDAMYQALNRIKPRECIRQVEGLPGVTSSYLLLVAMPGAPSSYLLLVAMPRAPSSFLLLI